MRQRTAARLWRAPAKVNLSLHVLGRRHDGYHELESLVAFGRACDWLAFEPADAFELSVEGPWAFEAGPSEQNLVMKAARALAERVEGLRPGRFRLWKLLPVAGGLGGGSSDAAAALRAIAAHNNLALDDERVVAAARSVGADVPVCLAPKARMMAGIGHEIRPFVDLPPLPTLLVNPRVATPTPAVFAALGLQRGADADFGPRVVFDGGASWMERLAAARNDLQSPAISLTPIIAEALEHMVALGDVRLARMTGSGATCFAIFPDRRSLARAALAIRASRPQWWVRATWLQ